MGNELTLEQLAELQEREEQLGKDKAGTDAEAAKPSVDALMNGEGTIKILGGKYEMPRISCRTLFLLDKVNSPLTNKTEGEEVQMSPGEMLETMYVIMNQDDPRIMQAIADPAAMDLAVFNFTGSIDMQDLEEIGNAITTQMLQVNGAAKDEDLGGDSSGGASGTTTS